MRKAYIQPDAEILSLKFLEDFLALSPDPDNPLDPDDEEDNNNNEMGGSSGNIDTERPGIW